MARAGEFAGLKVITGGTGVWAGARVQPILIGASRSPAGKAIAQARYAHFEWAQKSMNQTFEDHFSEHAQDYVRYRPCYSEDLFRYLASIAPGHCLAWDCGTGNGQAAVELAKHFERVVATDASAEQLDRAFWHGRIEYRVERAEEASLESSSVDLITVAIAVHWFDFQPFYRQVRRVLKPEGVLAVWTYYRPVIEPAVDHALARYEDEILAGYWPERIHYLREHYRTLPFPFHELSAPPFHMEAEWDLHQLLGFMHSWSASQKYLSEQGHHPLKIIWPDLSMAWGDASQKRIVRWPLYLRVGRSGPAHDAEHTREATRRAP